MQLFLDFPRGAPVIKHHGQDWQQRLAIGARALSDAHHIAQQLQRDLRFGIAFVLQQNGDLHISARMSRRAKQQIRKVIGQLLVHKRITQRLQLTQI